MRRWIFVLLGAFAATHAARAEETGGCAKFKWSVERERAWIAAGPAPVTATSEIALGEKAYRVSLVSSDAVTFIVPPERAPKAGTKAALLKFTVPSAGAYDVGLSGEGWIDVVQNGGAVKSSGFSGVKDCPGLRKSVRFKLGPGAAALQLSNILGDTIDVAIAPAP